MGKHLFAKTIIKDIWNINVFGFEIYKIFFLFLFFLWIWLKKVQ